MLIKLLSTQIPAFWDTIKFCCKEADMVKPENYQAYFNELLHSLLSDKAQCLVRLDEDRTIIALFITRIAGDKITGKKFIHVQTGYSFKPVQDDVWAGEFVDVVKMAKAIGCHKIILSTSNPNVIKITEKLRMTEALRTYEYIIGGN